MTTPPPNGGPVLASFAHPDDAEISCGGVLAKLAAAGREVHLLVLTNGDRGSDDPAMDRARLAEIRRVEVADGAGVLGLAGTRILDVHDGDLANTEAVRAEIALEIRRVRPSLVLTCDPTAWFFDTPEGVTNYFNHADHRRAGETTLDAVFPGAGNPHFFSDQLREGLEPWNVPTVWLSWTREPNHIEDVTGHADAKLEALRRHRSQVEGEMLGFFEEWLPSEMREMGARIGVEHAEAFRVIDLA